MKVVAVANQKGGVGKTTTAINLAYNLTLALNPNPAQDGMSGSGLTQKQCLLIDLDPQANATSGLGLAPEHSVGVYSLLVNQKPIKESIIQTSYAGLDALVATPLLSELSPNRFSPTQLKNSLKSLIESYDFIIIDCPPSFGIFSLNALVAADEVIIPIQCEYFAMEGLSQMLDIIDDTQEYNQNLKIGGILLTMYEPQQEFSEEVAAEVRQHFIDLTFRTIIPRDIALAEASSFGQPIMVYNPVARGTFAYIELCKEILSR